MRQRAAPAVESVDRAIRMLEVLGRHGSGASLDELVVVDTIPLSEAARGCSKIRQLSCAELLAETFKRISKGDSVSSLFAE